MCVRPWKLKWAQYLSRLFYVNKTRTFITSDMKTLNWHRHFSQLCCTIVNNATFSLILSSNMPLTWLAATGMLSAVVASSTPSSRSSIRLSWPFFELFFTFLSSFLDFLTFSFLSFLLLDFFLWETSFVKMFSLSSDLDLLCDFTS